MEDNIICISGIRDDNKATIVSISNNIIPNYDPSGNSNIYNVISEYFNCTQIVFDTKDNQQLKINRPSLIINEISDADTHKITLSKVESFQKNLKRNVPIINHPKYILETKRDSIYSNLKDIDNLYVPKTVRFSPKSPSEIFETIHKEKFKLPVIMRKAGDHGGISTLLIKSLDNIEIFNSVALNGDEFYLTQFVDYKVNNIYTKYRLVVICGQVYLRHIICSDNWLIHAQNKTDNNKSIQQKLQEEFEEKTIYKISPIIKKIHEVLKLEYFGIDCNIDENHNILIFEINANMNIFVGNNMDNINNISIALQKMISNYLKS